MVTRRPAPAVRNGKTSRPSPRAASAVAVGKPPQTTTTLPVVLPRRSVAVPASGVPVELPEGAQAVAATRRRRAEVGSVALPPPDAVGRRLATSTAGPIPVAHAACAWLALIEADVPVPAAVVHTRKVGVAVDAVASVAAALAAALDARLLLAKAITGAVAAAGRPLLAARGGVGLPALEVAPPSALQLGAVQSPATTSVAEAGRSSTAGAPVTGKAGVVQDATSRAGTALRRPPRPSLPSKPRLAAPTRSTPQPFL